MNGVQSAPRRLPIVHLIDASTFAAPPAIFLSFRGVA